MFVTGIPVCLVSFVIDLYFAIPSRKITYGFPINDSEMNSCGKNDAIAPSFLLAITVKFR